LYDGYLQNKGLHLNTYGFSNQEVLNLKSSLENMFGENSLKCSILKHKKGNRIYIWGKKHGCDKTQHI
jgi:hypothetical protein